MSVVSVVRYRSQRRADHSSRGVLPTVMYRCVSSRNLVNEKAPAHWGLLPQKQKPIVSHAGPSWLRHCAASRKVAGSFPDCDTGIFH
jgi:hypothetical protein